MQRISRFSIGLLAALLAAAAGGIQPTFAQQQQRTVRVTTGSVQVSGWEKGIIQANPNLSHFTWMPMSQNLQGVRVIPGTSIPRGELVPKKTGQPYLHAPTQTSSGSHYVKPIHIDTEVNRTPYIKPNHIDTEVSGRPLYPKPMHIDTEVSGRPFYSKPTQIETQVSGRPIYTKPVHVTEAGSERSYVSGQLRQPTREDGQGTQRQARGDVFGRLRSTSPATEQHSSGSPAGNPAVARYAPLTNQQGSSRGQLLETKEVYGKLKGSGQK
jgi:hypothetical protein